MFLLVFLSLLLLAVSGIFVIPELAQKPESISPPPLPDRPHLNELVLESGLPDLDEDGFYTLFDGKSLYAVDPSDSLFDDPSSLSFTNGTLTLSTADLTFTHPWQTDSFACKLSAKKNAGQNLSLLLRGRDKYHLMGAWFNGRHGHTFGLGWTGGRITWENFGTIFVPEDVYLKHHLEGFNTFDYQVKNGVQLLAANKAKFIDNFDPRPQMGSGSSEFLKKLQYFCIRATNSTVEIQKVRANSGKSIDDGSLIDVKWKDVAENPFDSLNYDLELLKEKFNPKNYLGAEPSGFEVKDGDLWFMVDSEFLSDWDLNNDDPHSIKVVGKFCNWDRSQAFGLELMPDGIYRGKWGAASDLKGFTTFKFLVDDEWVVVPESVRNTQGKNNNIVFADAASATIETLHLLEAKRRLFNIARGQNLDKIAVNSSDHAFLEGTRPLTLKEALSLLDIMACEEPGAFNIHPSALFSMLAPVFTLLGKDEIENAKVAYQEIKQSAGANHIGIFLDAVGETMKIIDEPEAYQGPYVVEEGGVRRFLVMWPLQWYKAGKACEKLGGRLARIETRAEFDALLPLIEIYKDFNWPSYQVQVWINGTDFHSEGEWRYFNGEKIKHIPWALGEPNDGDHSNGEDYLTLENTFGVHDHHEGFRPFILEIPK